MNKPSTALSLDTAFAVRDNSIGNGTALHLAGILNPFGRTLANVMLWYLSIVLCLCSLRYNKWLMDLILNLNGECSRMFAL